MRFAPSTFAVDDRRAGAEVDLSLFTWCHFDTSKWQRLCAVQLGNVSSNAVILSSEAVVVDQILEDPLRRKSLLKLDQNQLMKLDAQAPRAGGRIGRF